MKRFSFSSRHHPPPTHLTICGDCWRKARGNEYCGILLDLLILPKEIMSLEKVFLLMTLSTSCCLPYCLALWDNSKQEALYPSLLHHSTYTYSKCKHSQCKAFSFKNSKITFLLTHLGCGFWWCENMTVSSTIRQLCWQPINVLT